MSSLAFDFGRNWQAFSEAKLDAQRLNAAIASLQELMGAENIRGKTFLDIGCGSGLFSIAAAQCGAAQVLGFDVSPQSIEVSENNWARLANFTDATTIPYFRTGDVLDDTLLAELDTFDIVYAWGVLHHTGAMWEAIRKAASLVEPENGTFVIAIYNHHWTSPIWKQIKRLYNLSPDPLRRMLNYFFAIAIYVGVWVTARQNPLHKERGMDFWYDVIDWLGGYPYEYGRITDVVKFVEPLGFQADRITKPRGWTGCNEFVFRRSKPSHESN